MIEYFKFQFFFAVSSQNTMITGIRKRAPKHTSIFALPQDFQWMQCVLSSFVLEFGTHLRTNYSIGIRFETRPSLLQLCFLITVVPAIELRIPCLWLQLCMSARHGQQNWQQESRLQRTKAESRGERRVGLKSVFAWRSSKGQVNLTLISTFGLSESLWHLPLQEHAQHSALFSVSDYDLQSGSVNALTVWTPRRAILRSSVVFKTNRRETDSRPS